jgi:hypothetical protein
MHNPHFPKQDALAFGDHFLADAISGDDRDAVLGMRSLAKCMGMGAVWQGVSAATRRPWRESNPEL